MFILLSGNDRRRICLSHRSYRYAASREPLGHVEIPIVADLLIRVSIFFRRVSLVSVPILAVNLQES